MDRKKSIKKFIEVGSIIKLKDGSIYEVTELQENKFVCELINDYELIFMKQEFYYNIDMEVYHRVASNIEI